MNTVTLCVLTITTVLLSWIPEASSHGRLKNPAGRSSMWRYGYNNPPNYNDNQLFCGGREYQWNHNGGNCGVCGDPANGAKENEAGGTYANGVITGRFQEGKVIPITVEITANHKGWFEFRLCPVNNKYVKATQQCLDRYLLKEASSHDTTRIDIGSRRGLITSHMQLPPGVTCSQCVLQWKYHTGNSWGVDEGTGMGCVGCGVEQEEFYGCADISIGHHTGDHNGGQTPEPQDPTTTTEDSIWEDDSSAMICRSAGVYAGQPSMDTWCSDNCRLGNCPSTHCKCFTVQEPLNPRQAPLTRSQSPTSSPPSPSRAAPCRYFVARQSSPFNDAYCQTTCTMGLCPLGFCQCSPDGSTRIMTCQPRDPAMRSLPYVNEFCSALCSMGYCPYECMCL